jgi:hypothetical protein
VWEIRERDRYSFEPPSNTSRANMFHDYFEHVTPSLDRVSRQHSLERYMVYLAVTPSIALEDGTCVRRVETFTRRSETLYGCTLNEEDGRAVTT